MITQQDLISQNYSKEEWTDKDFPEDKFDTLKFIEYKKEINDYFAIEVNFAFKADEPDEWRSIEITCELACNSGYYISLPPDIDKLEQIYGLLKQK